MTSSWDTRAFGIGHKCMTEGRESKNVWICRWHFSLRLNCLQQLIFYPPAGEASIEAWNLLLNQQYFSHSAWDYPKQKSLKKVSSCGCQSCFCQPIFNLFASKSVILVVCFQTQTCTICRGCEICHTNYKSSCNSYSRLTRWNNSLTFVLFSGGSATALQRRIGTRVLVTPKRKCSFSSFSECRLVSTRLVVPNLIRLLWPSGLRGYSNSCSPLYPSASGNKRRCSVSRTKPDC